MDQIKIGNFISKKRKEKNITKNKLAEMLGITDRAVSKWENGICIPNASNIPKLCEILDITINDLFSGEVVNMKDYNKKAEENLLEITQVEEKLNKKTMSSLTFIILIFVLSCVIENNITRIVLFILAFAILIIGVIFALKIETETGYYECSKCHNKYVPKYLAVFFAMHMGTTRYLKCPKCNKRSWNKKVLKR